jgi:hypothetical protein
MSDGFAGAFATARGGFVRDSLIGSYPRLAGLLEAAAARVLRDSSARDVAAALDGDQVSSCDQLGLAWLGLTCKQNGDVVQCDVCDSKGGSVLCLKHPLHAICRSTPCWKLPATLRTPTRRKHLRASARPPRRRSPAAAAG